MFFKKVFNINKKEAFGTNMVMKKLFLILCGQQNYILTTEMILKEQKKKDKSIISLLKIKLALKIFLK